MYVRYFRARTAEAWRPTAAFIKQRIVVGLTLTAIAGAAAGFYWWETSAQLPITIVVGLLSTLLAAVLLAATVLLWNWCAAPYRIWRKQIEELESNKATYNPEVARALQTLFARGDLLRQGHDSITLETTGNAELIAAWIDEVSEFLNQNIPNERFMFYSAGGIFYRNAVVRIGRLGKEQGALNTKLEKLRLIIGRYEDRRRAPSLARD